MDAGILQPQLRSLLLKGSGGEAASMAVFFGLLYACKHSRVESPPRANRLREETGARV